MSEGVPRRAHRAPLPHMSGDAMEAQLAAAETPSRGRTKRPVNRATGQPRKSLFDSSSSSTSSSPASSTPKRNRSPSKSPVRKGSPASKKSPASAKKSAPSKKSATGSPASGKQRAASPAKRAAASPAKRASLSDDTNDPLKKYRAMATRTVVGSVMIAGFLNLIKLNHGIMAVFVIVLQMLVFRELVNVRYNAVKERAIPWFRLLNWYLLVITLLFVYMPQFFSLIRKNPREDPSWLEPVSHNFDVAMFVAYLVAFVGFVSTLQRGTLKYQFSQMTWTVMILLLVVVQAHVVVKNIFIGLVWLILPSSLIICNDISAYFCGFFLGKKFIKSPLTSLSPNKSWEGFLGAWVMTTIFAWILAGVLAEDPWFRCPQDYLDLRHLSYDLTCPAEGVFKPQPAPHFLASILRFFAPLPFSGISIGATGEVVVAPLRLHAVVFAAFASLVAPFSGFFMSAIKRAYSIKDFDTLFPGHGGVTDRFDCQLLNTLFVYVYYEAFIKVAPVLFDRVLQQAQGLNPGEKQKLIESLNQIV